MEAVKAQPKIPMQFQAPHKLEVRATLNAGRRSKSKAEDAMPGGRRRYSRDRMKKYFARWRGFFIAKTMPRSSLWFCNARLAAHPALHGRAMCPKTQLFFPLPIPSPIPPSWAREGVSGGWQVRSLECRCHAVKASNRHQGAQYSTDLEQFAGGGGGSMRRRHDGPWQPKLRHVRSCQITTHCSRTK